MTAEEVRALIERYNAAWNAQDLDAIMALHTPDMVFENHTAGEQAQGEAVRAHIAGIFDAWPDISFATRRLYVRDDLAVNEWTATATHQRPLRRSGLEAAPTGREVSWEGIDVFPVRDGLIARKDVYADSISILRQVGLLS